MSIITGTAGNDLLFSLIGNNFYDGQDGDDTIYGGFGNDTLWGGNGNDVIRDLSSGHWQEEWIGGPVSSGDDLLYGGYGNDTIYGGYGADTIRGYFGDDVIRSFNNDTVYGGVDTKDMMPGDTDNDTIYGGELTTAYGLAGDDYIQGNIVDGGDGNDFIVGMVPIAFIGDRFSVRPETC